MAEKKLWDFVSQRGESVIIEWVKSDRITVRDPAKLNNKIKRLAQLDYELAVGTKLLAGPIYKHVYKLVVHGDVMLRPMLCRGPFDPQGEYTFLLGAVETGGKLPDGAKERAERNREELSNDPTRRRTHGHIN